MKNKTVRIGAGCSIDITLAIPQMVRDGDLDYMVIDFLTEGSLGRMAGELEADPEKGYGDGIAGPEIAAEMQRILSSGLKVVTNAGGHNPLACAERLRALAADLGFAPKIAVVHGDDVREVIEAGDAAEYADLHSGAPRPPKLITANAYLGAKPIAAALAKGADFVITGRVVDSALTLGPLIHEFGWAMDDYDRLAGGTLIGHLLECGPQPAGGIFTDWREIDWADSSFPIAECAADGTAVFTKVDGTGGQISVGTISEQILYEIGDPQRYFMPDVTVDLSQARVEALGKDKVRVSGARGLPPTGAYKVCAYARDGWRGVVSGLLSGPDLREKAEKLCTAVLERTRRILLERNLGEYRDTSFELIGDGTSHGAHAPPIDPRELVYRIIVDHEEKEGAELMFRVSGAGMVAMAPGVANSLGNSVAPLMQMHQCYLDKTKASPKLTVDGETEEIAVPTGGGFDSDALPPPPAIADVRVPGGPAVPLVSLAWTRSGDKGDMSNIGVIARSPDYAPYLKSALTPEAVAAWFAHLFADPDNARVLRYDLPGLNALNLMLYGSLDGGVVRSRRFDKMGKGLGQQILDFPVAVTPEIAAAVGYAEAAE